MSQQTSPGDTTPCPTFYLLQHIGLYNLNVSPQTQPGGTTPMSNILVIATYISHYSILVVITKYVTADFAWRHNTDVQDAALEVLG